jgi:hypothetical protein
VPYQPDFPEGGLIARDAAWEAFKASYARLSDAEMMQPGVTGDWSVRDILAHVTTWEEDATPRRCRLRDRLLLPSQ